MQKIKKYIKKYYKIKKIKLKKITHLKNNNADKKYKSISNKFLKIECPTFLYSVDSQNVNK